LESDNTAGKSVVDQASNFLSRASHFALHLSTGYVKQLPMADRLKGPLQQFEGTVLRGLRDRLDHVEPDGGNQARSVATYTAASAPFQTEINGSYPQPGAIAAQTLQQLLEVSTEQTLDQAKNTFFARIVRELVPDEARILSALADGSVYPLIHIAAGPPIGQATRRVLENVSNIGKASGVRWAIRTPVYVTHLRRLGLVETGSEDESLSDKYEILKTYPETREAEESIRKGGGRLSVRHIRRTLRITDLGRELWTECQMSRQTF
jgi:Abortive infection alpha